MDSVIKAALEEWEEPYEFIRRLGGGEFSNVYLIKHTPTGKELAVKILDYHYLLQKLKKESLLGVKPKFDEIKKRFITETKLFKKIEHPNIVNIHRTGTFYDKKEDIEIPYFVMDYVKGSSLAAVVEKEGAFSMDRIMRISTGVLNALEVIHHRYIIHRDLKPANIMIEQETGKAVLIDFGIAKDIVGGTRMTNTGMFLGSPVYMAPEQFIDSSKVGPKIDIYAFGVVLFEMLTGTPPYEGKNFIELMNAHRRKSLPLASRLKPNLPPDMDNVLSRATSKDPDNRFKNAPEMLRALKRVVEGKGYRPPARRPYYYYAAAGIAVMAVLFFLLNPFGAGREKQDPGPKPPPPKAGKTSPGEKPPEPKTAQAVTPPHMETDYTALKAFLQGPAGEEKKLEKTRLFLEKYRDTLPADDETGQKRLKDVRTLAAALETGRAAEENYHDYIKRAQTYLEEEEPGKATGLLEKAQRAKKTYTAAEKKEMSQLAAAIEAKQTALANRDGETEFRAMETAPTLEKYKTFVQTFPGSRYLPELTRLLKNRDKRLPPHRYWNDALVKNPRGYYEYRFGPEKNGHTMVFVPERRLWVDKYEVSNRCFRVYAESQGTPGIIPPGDKYIHAGDGYPVVVTYDTALAYCRHFGFRLPRVEEWEYVAGKGRSVYPWGNATPDENNLCRANYDTLEGEKERDGFKGTAPVKSFEPFSSPFGVVNLVGNVWEWATGRLLKGGGFFSEKDALKIEHGMNGGLKDKEGFRCVMDEKEE